MLPRMIRLHTTATHALVLVGAALAAWLPARAHAGDRAFYVAVVDAPRPDGAPSPGGVMEAFVSAMLDCGATALPACRAAHREGSDLDTGGNFVVFDLPAQLALRDVLAAARGRPAAARTVRTGLGATDIDAIVVLEHPPTGGAVTVTVVWRDGRRVTRTTDVWQRPNAAPGIGLMPAHFGPLITRLRRALSRRFVP